MSSDEANIVEKWFKNCEYDDNNVQKAVAKIFANLFESYIEDKDNLKTQEEHLQTGRPAGGPLVIFNNATLGNTELWATALEQLVKFGFAQDPALASNTRRPIKIAHTLYPGDAHKDMRAQATTAIEQYYLAEKFKKQGLRTPQNAGSSVPSPRSEGTNTQQIPVPQSGGSASSAPILSRPINANLNVATNNSNNQLPNNPVHIYNALIAQANQLWNMMQRSSQQIPANTAQVHPIAMQSHPEFTNIAPQSNFPSQPPGQSQPHPHALFTSPQQYINPAIYQHSASQQMHNSQNLSPRRSADNRNLDTHYHNSRNATNVSYRFKMKDSKYSGADEENIHDFLTQYELVSRDLGLSPAEMLQYFHNLFREEALRYYNSYVFPSARDVDTASRLMREQFHSISKQQCVKAELGSLAFKEFLKKENGDKRKAMRSLMSHIESRLPLCPENWQHETNKVDFLRQAMLSEEWALPSLYKISSETRFRSLYTELANSLQVHEEAKAQHATRQNSEDSKSNLDEQNLGSKPEILFTAPRYANKIAKALFPGSEQDRTCWNCGKNGHRFPKCRLPLNAATIAARKAKFYEKKKMDRNGAKRVLYEMSMGANSLFNQDLDSDDEEVTTYFHDSNETDDEDDESTQNHVHFNNAEEIIEFSKEPNTSEMDF